MHAYHIVACTNFALQKLIPDTDQQQTTAQNKLFSPTTVLNPDLQAILKFGKLCSIQLFF